MNHILNILKKEVRELLTPATIVPILVVSLVFGGLGNMIGGAAEEATDSPTIGLITLDNGSIAQRAADIIADRADIAYNDTSPSIDQGISAVRATAARRCSSSLPPSASASSPTRQAPSMCTG